MTIQNHYGQWLMGTNGEVAGNCCCGPEEATTACSLEAPCAGGDPSMQVTVFDADYAGGSISWVGKTWTQQEVKDGVTKCVCPPNYDQQNQTTGTSQYAYHRWSYNASQYNRLRLLRRANVNSFQDYGLNQMALGVAGYGSGFYGDFVTFQTQVTSFSSIQLGFLTAPTPAAPTLNDYHITDDFFGSYTHANGIQYSWDKGVGWP